MPRTRKRAAWIVVLTIFGFLVGTAALGAQNSVGADPSTNWQLTPTAGLQNATASDGVKYPYLVMPTGGRWYLECPMKIEPASRQLVPSLSLSLDHDRCGNDQGSVHTYSGASWKTTSLASVNVDPDDPRCGQLIAHRADAVPPDAVSPVFCNDRVLVYPTLNNTLAKQLSTWWPDNVLDTCPPPMHSSLACGKLDDGKGDTVALQWWHGDHNGGVDCGHIPADHVPVSISAWAQGDAGRLKQACQLLNNYFLGTATPFIPTLDMLSADRQALQESGPAKNPPWQHAVRGKDVKTATAFDWNRIAGAVGGCLVGGAGGSLLGGPVGLVIGCAAGGIAGVAAANWLEGKDCTLTSWHCIVNAVSRWMANGLVDELKFALNQLVHGLNPTTLFGTDIFIRLWLVLTLISALLAMLYALLSLGVSMAVLRPSIAMTTVRNIAIWGWGLAVAVPFVKLVLAAVDGLTTAITTVGAGSSWSDLAARFQSVLGASLGAAVPSSSDVTVSILLFLMLIVGGVAALFLAAYALGRSAGIALATLGIPIAMAGLVGPPALRRGPQVTLAMLFGLIMFKPLVAVVFLLGIGLMGTGASMAAFMIGVLCVLGAAFAPWKIIRLFGAGIDHVAHGAAGHTAVVAGAAAVGGSAGALYQQSRGMWRSGGGGPAQTGAAAVGAAAPSGAGSGGRHAAVAGAVRGAPLRAAQPATAAAGVAGNGNGHRPAPPPPASGSPRTAQSPTPAPASPAPPPATAPSRTTAADVVARHRGADS
ncbi:MAG TPA: hypothetical protein VGL39_00350 [Jatrophihabitantaceae bacterium]|jgi:hypothetical protein